MGHDKGKRFVETLFRYHAQEVKLAFCMFAQPENEWEETRSSNESMFDTFKGERVISYQTMNNENFAEVSAWADVVYVPGGDPAVLQERLMACGDVAKLWDGKVIAGSSAGADFMCEGFIFLQDKTYARGFGWVKATCIPHWRSAEWKGYAPTDWDFIEQKALQEAPDTAVLCLPESELVEYTVR